MKRPRTLDTTECKHAIRHYSGTDNPQLYAFDYRNSFTISQVTQKQCLRETKQPPFRKPNSILFIMVLSPRLPTLNA